MESEASEHWNAGNLKAWVKPVGSQSDVEAALFSSAWAASWVGGVEPLEKTGRLLLLSLASSLVHISTRPDIVEKY